MREYETIDRDACVTKPARPYSFTNTLAFLCQDISFPFVTRFSSPSPGFSGSSFFFMEGEGGIVEYKAVGKEEERKEIFK